MTIIIVVIFLIPRITQVNQILNQDKMSKRPETAIAQYFKNEQYLIDWNLTFFNYKQTNQLKLGYLIISSKKYL